MHHAQSSYLNTDIVKSFSTALYNNIWTFSLSSENKFYTSDFPICVNPHKENVRPMNMGLTQEGAELTFPISKSLVLTIWDRNYFSDKSEDDMSISVSNDEEIRALNLIRYITAKRQVYGYSNDFSYIQFVVMCRRGEQIYINPFP